MRPIRQSLRTGIERVRRQVARHVHALLHRPHHYLTALGCTVLMVLLGHLDHAALTAFWLYALVENVTDQS